MTVANPFLMQFIQARVMSSGAGIQLRPIYCKAVIKNLLYPLFVYHFNNYE